MKLDGGLNIGGLIFERGNYDAENDVLYLGRTPSNKAARGEGTIEGHGVHFDDDDRVIRLTIINAKWLLERDGYLKITFPIPQEVRISPEAMAPAFDLVKNKAAA